MGDIVEFPPQKSEDDEQVFDQASLWIARISRGLNANEEQQLKNWLAVPAHRSTLFKMAEIWDKMDSLQRLAELFPTPKPCDSQTANAEPQNEPRQAQSTRARKDGASIFTAVAAAAMVMLAIFYGVSLQRASHQPPSSHQVFSTAVGESSAHRLSDGSHLQLNTNALVRVEYSSEQRLLILERGEVAIEVAHDARRPLNVIVGNRVVQAVGTAFNIRIHKSGQAELTVTEGTVRVREFREFERNRAFARLPATALTVVKGDRVTLGREAVAKVKLEPGDIAADFSWRQGNLVFKGETLEQALAEVSRYTDIQFEIADDEIRDRQIAGLFKSGDIPGLLMALEKNFHIKSRAIDDNKIILSKD